LFLFPAKYFSLPRNIKGMTRESNDYGAALLLALIALALFSLLGLYMSLNATTEVRISDNYESHVRATYAALSGLNHTRVLLRGLVFDDLLIGPDGIYDGAPANLARARGFAFRNPVTLMTAYSLDISNPAGDLSGLPDDGLVNTGSYGGIPGTELIPRTGVSQTSPNPNGSGETVLSRYFVKVTDNNGDPSEIAGDANDNPYIDGDGIVIVRSIGIAGTIPEVTGAALSRNSVVIFEARYKRRSLFGFGPALVVQAANVNASFTGAYEISGGLFPGIGTIDLDQNDLIQPDQIIRAAATETGTITGGGLPEPAVADITGRIASGADASLLLRASSLWEFIHVQAPQFADRRFQGDQDWVEGNSPYAGSMDPAKPLNAPGQDPIITFVDGNLRASGDFSGGGLLIITGEFSCSGRCAYNGLVLVAGSGRATLEGPSQGIEGGMYVVGLYNNGGEIGFGPTTVSFSGGRIVGNPDAVRMALSLIPVSQISFREIAGSDP
jgi:hypothetical protein